MREIFMKRFTIAAALVLTTSLGGLALAQNTPSSSNSSSSSSGYSTHTSPSDSSMQQPSSEKMSAQDPKMKKCISAQKAKNSGMTDDQIQQKCMAHVMSHQNKDNQQQSSPQ
jgi:hypothetical protein